VADSTTGLVLDAYPNDSACYLPAHGDGITCNIGSTIGAYTPDQVLADEGGVIYLLSRARNRVYRWDPAAAAYLNPMVVGSTSFLETTTPGQMAYAPDQDRLYFGYPNGAITYVDLAGDSLAERSFTATSTAVATLQGVGSHLWVGAPASGSTARYNYVYDMAGHRTDDAGSYYSRESAWNPVLGRIYFFRDGISPNDLLFQQIDAGGRITTQGETPYHGAYEIRGPIRVSAAGDKVLLGTGDIYDANSLTWLGALPQEFTDGRWLADGGLVTVRASGTGTVLERRNAAGQLVERVQFAGAPISIHPAGTSFVVVTAGTQPVFNSYTPSDDSDGDGASNTIDAFPLDAAASLDSDGDGYPDAWNDGRTEADSTTGLVLDAYPNDSACYLPAHGDGVTCNVASTIPAYVPDETVVDGNGVVYLFSATNNRVYRYDTATGAHLNPIVVGSTEFLATSSPSHMAHSPAHNRLYFGYDSGAITYVDLATGSLAEHDFATTAGSVQGLAAAGNFVMAQDPTGAWATHYVFDATGTLRTSADWNYYSRSYAWNPALSRIYFFRDSQSPDDLHYEVINQGTGLITGEGETPYHGDDEIDGPIRVSPAGDKVLLGSGDIYDASSLTWLGALPATFADAQWLADGGLVTIRASGGGTVLERRSAAGALVEVVQFAGAPIAIHPAGTSFVVVTGGSRPVFHTYAPSDDSDGDGAGNTSDAFPLDVAASLDSDGDGHPDAWNDGRTEADSTTGLALDAYPNDSACYLPAHGDGVTCNVASTIPAYVPDETVVDAAGVVYLFSSANNRIYRYDAASGEHLNPIVVGSTEFLATSSPSHMAYSPAHNRLYFGYDSGAITYVDLATGSLAEHDFATTAGPVRGLAAAVNFLLAQDPSGAWATHYVFDVTGARRTRVDWNYYSRAYAWSPALSRIYFFRDDTSPNDLHYEVINQGTGLITGEGETPYHGSYSIIPPIRISADGSKVLLGSGDIYDGSSLTWLGALPSTFTDAQWLADGGTVTISAGGSSTVLERRSIAGPVVETAQFTGTPRNILPVGGGRFVVVTSSSSRPAFALYTPSDDSDGDGAGNTSDSFPLDAAASLDTDGDGYPDAWNDGRTQADSTTGLALDAYPGDSACYLPAHGDGVTCNIASTLPPYTPDEVVIDDGGVIYLLSSAYNRVFRYDTVTGEHLNPIVVGSMAFLGSRHPALMAYSQAHFRLYFGYDSGAITYVDLATDSPVEHDFAATAEPVQGLAVAGNFVLAQDPSGAWATHYVFDANGSLRTSADWNYYSRAYAWNAALGRIYFFRDSQSPDDLHYEVIDQGTGLITGKGETPYHGDYPIVPPIIVSPDGSKVLLGSGNVYDATTLNRLGGFNGFLDGRWLPDGRIILIRNAGLSTALELRDAALSPVDTTTLAGTPIAVLNYGLAVTVVTSAGAGPIFNSYAPPP
jgi:hypothetical protein